MSAEGLNRGRWAGSDRTFQEGEFAVLVGLPNPFDVSETFF